MNNSNKNSSGFKIQNSHKIREIENQLEKEITGIVNKQKMFANASGRFSNYSGVSENVSSKLKSFLDERLSKRNPNSKGYNEQAYDQSIDYETDNNYNNKRQMQDDSYNNNYDNQDDYYDDEEFYENEDYDDESYDDYDDEEEDSYRDKRVKESNPNTYLPFTYEELQPEMPSSKELESMILDNMMPSIAQWLDLNIDRIVHKVVKESLSNRGQPERYSERRYNRGNSLDSNQRDNVNEYTSRYSRGDRDFQPKENSRAQERSRISDSIKSIEKGSARNSISPKNTKSSKGKSSLRGDGAKKPSSKDSFSEVNKSSRSSISNRNVTKR